MDRTSTWSETDGIGFRRRIRFLRLFWIPKTFKNIPKTFNTTFLIYNAIPLLIDNAGISTIIFFTKEEGCLGIFCS